MDQERRNESSQQPSRNRSGRNHYRHNRPYKDKPVRQEEAASEVRLEGKPGNRPEIRENQRAPQQQRDQQRASQQQRQGGQNASASQQGNRNQTNNNLVREQVGGQNSPKQNFSGPKGTGFVPQRRPDLQKQENAGEPGGSGLRERNDGQRNFGQRDRLYPRQNIKKEVETVEDIRKDIVRLEKEIELDIREIKSMRLGI